DALASGPAGKVNIGGAGTAMRFLAAYYAATPGTDILLDGDERMRQRPIGQLVDALRACGADVEYAAEEGFPPLKIKGKRLKGGRVTVDATVSSQFVSALLMVAPTMEEGLTLDLDGEPVSLPYILLTLGMMEDRGATIDRTPLTISVEPGSYFPLNNDSAEGDWSAAAFFYEITALTAGWLTLKGLRADSRQGDRRAAEYFERLGVITAPSEDFDNAVDLQPTPDLFGRFDADLSDTPDLAPALVVTAAMLGIPFRVTGLQSLGIKECDRLRALVEELEKTGTTIERVRDFGLEWDGRRHPIAELPVFDARGDHRMAMALAPVAAYIPGITIRGAETVAKSYPGYWDALRALGFTLEPAEPA
ncbi:MAG: 3-phosphoshikimate 1-carboxyvinyltransferase, partial [Alistipes timonensis]|nr:3-phosphoshikimate 1-carboxyvinyltransferase [Alistipes timonensis]